MCSVIKMSAQNTLSSVGLYLSTVPRHLPSLSTQTLPFPGVSAFTFTIKLSGPLTKQSSDLRASGLSILFFCLFLSWPNHLIFHVFLIYPSYLNNPRLTRVTRLPTTGRITNSLRRHSDPRCRPPGYFPCSCPSSSPLVPFPVLTQVATCSTCTANRRRDCCLLDKE
jgi:hypothetical protein